MSLAAGCSGTVFTLHLAGATNLVLLLVSLASVNTNATGPVACACKAGSDVVMITHVGIGLNSLQYGVLYLGSHYSTGPYINFPHFGNSNLGKLPCAV